MTERPKLTLNWRGKTARLPDVRFVDITVDVPQPVRMPHVVTVPPLPIRTPEQQHYDNVLLLLDSWAEWIRTGEPLADGVPRQCLGAPDARIHSFEDMEIEVNKRLVRVVQTAVWELGVIEREAVMTHYGLNTRSVWRANFDAVFNDAVKKLFTILRNRIAC
jgi:hypothetical protein